MEKFIDISKTVIRDNLQKRKRFIRFLFYHMHWQREQQQQCVSRTRIIWKRSTIFWRVIVIKTEQITT